MTFYHKMRTICGVTHFIGLSAYDWKNKKSEDKHYFICPSQLYANAILSYIIGIGWPVLLPFEIFYLHDSDLLHTKDYIDTCFHRT